MHFNENEIQVRRRFPRGTVIAIAIAVLFSAVAVWGLYQTSVANAALKAASAELTAEKAKVAELESKLDKRTVQFERDLATASATCTSDSSALQNQVAAFAKQAAACEVIRLKLAAR